MSRSEAYSGRAGLLLLAVGVFAIAKWVVAGGPTNVTAAVFCLVGSLAAFVLAWRWSWSEVEAGAASLGESRGRPRMFPIADYDDLWEDEILPLLQELDDDELEDVRRHEMSRSARSNVVNEIQTLLVRRRVPRRGLTRR